MEQRQKKLWFKRKWFGWGWYPASWEGWVVTLVYIGLLLAFSMTVDETSPTREVWFTFILPVILLTIAFIRLAYATGEKPRWQWGRPRDEDVQQDKDEQDKDKTAL